MQIYEHEFWIVGQFVASDEHTSNSIDDLVVVTKEKMAMVMQTID